MAKEETNESMQSAKNAFMENKLAKVCYVNAQGEWLFSVPGKDFGPVVKTYTKVYGEKGELAKITEKNG